MENNIHIRFPQSGGGLEQGPNDSGLEHFMGDIERYIARECVQNSIDARLDHEKPVRVEFTMQDIDPNTIPGLSQLRDEIIPSCQEFYSNDENASDYCNKALRILGSQTLKLLRVADFNTKGLNGGDEDREGNWYALVKSSGVTNKDDAGSAGSFGIGKHAPFAASALRTTFYGTVTLNGDSAFQGVSKWWTHLNHSGRKTQGTGYVGLYNESEGRDPSFWAVRESDLIPDVFRREKTGTDIWIPGVLFEDNWEDQLAESILDNFWMAIHDGILEVNINGVEITRENLEQQLNRFSSNPNFQAYSFYFAIQLSEKLSKSFPFIGEVELYLLSDWDVDLPLPKRISGLRKTGMTIENRRFHCRRHFSGVLLCRNDEGNKFLRSIEPPRHDRWDRERIKERGGKSALDNMWKWVKEQVQELNPKPKDDATDVPGLADFLPDIPSQDKSSPDSDANIKLRTVTGEISTSTTTPAQPEGTGLTGGEEEGRGLQGKETTDTGGDGGGSGKSLPGREKIRPLKTRSMKLSNGKYQIIIHPEYSAVGDIIILSSADDGSTEKLERITNVSLKEGTVFKQQVTLPLSVPAALSSQLITRKDVL